MTHRCTMTLRTQLIDLWRRREGAAAVEFGLIAPVFLFLLLGTIEIGRLLWTQNALNYAVQEAARCTTLNTCGSGGAAAYAATLSTDIPASAFTATNGVACGAGVTGNQVTGSYNFQFLTSLIGMDLLVGGALPNQITLTATSCFPT